MSFALCSAKGHGHHCYIHMNKVSCGSKGVRLRNETSLSPSATVESSVTLKEVFILINLVYYM